MKRLLSLTYGVIAYGVFLPTFAYTICFLGNIAVPKTIDSGIPSSPILAVLLNAALLTLFAVQHSVMARKGFKQVWTKIIPKHLERPTYVLAASLVLILLLWQWRPIPQTVWEIEGVGAIILRITFWMGWALLLSSTFLINHFELFGLQQVWEHFRRKQYGKAKFRTPILYRIVRHPLYLGFMVAFWSAPKMSVGHLLFSIATTAYILVGIHFEENDLVAEHGEAYRNYRQQVPMLVPFSKIPSATLVDQRNS
jgi:methanethiol S-methyltransferase